MTPEAWVTIVVLIALVVGVIRGWTVHVTVLMTAASSQSPPPSGTLSEVVAAAAKAFGATVLLGLAIVSAAQFLT